MNLINSILKYKVIIFIFCIIENINTYKIYKFIQQNTPVLFESDICTSKICHEDANYILSSLNTAVDPCEDFYEFACGGWITKNPRPNSQPVWGRWETIMQNMENTIQQILLQEKENDFTFLNKAKNMYKACIISDSFEKETIALLNNLLSNFGGWPIISKNWISTNYNWLHMVAKINSHFNVHPLINFHVSIDLYDTSKYQLYIDHPSFIFPKSVVNNPSIFERYLKTYELYIIESALELMEENDNRISMNELRFDAYDIIKFEIKLINIMSDNENYNNLKDIYQTISISHLQYLTDLVSTQNKEKIHWLKVFKTLFQHTNITLSLEDNIIIKDLNYVLKLMHLMEITSLKIIANYIGWNMVKYFSKDATANFREFSFSMDKIIHGAQEDVSKNQYCMAIVNKYFGSAIAHTYIKENFDPKIINEIYDLTNNIQAVLISKLDTLKWLDETTKMRAIEKAKAINAMIGFPEWLNNGKYLENIYGQINVSKYHILNILSCLKFHKEKELLKLNSSVNKLKERWSGMPTDINAYYNVLNNVIILPAGVLQYPFFNSNRIKSMNYGAIGTIIGHEFSHAFDNTGRQADENGNLIQWWTKQSLNQYYDVTKCFKDHFKNYSLHIINQRRKMKILISDQKTQDENIADVIGLDLAYTAMKKIEKNDLKLPGLENFSTDQFFFLSYANQWCESASEEKIISSIIDDDHIPNKIRVIGTLSNNEVFSRVFNCSVGSVMNPVKKCLL